MSRRDRHRVQNALAVSQMAFALVLLVGSGLMLRSMQSLRNVDPGFNNAESVMALRVTIPSQEIPDPEETARTFELIARRLVDIPGVESVGMSTGIPMDGSGNVNPFYADGASHAGSGLPPSRRHKWIGEHYFETLQTPLLAGRTFTWEDVHTDSQVPYCPRAWPGNTGVQPRRRWVKASRPGRSRCVGAE